MEEKMEEQYARATGIETSVKEKVRKQDEGPGRLKKKQSTSLFDEAETSPAHQHMQRSLTGSF
jgi:hypothetical protein